MEPKERMKILIASSSVDVGKNIPAIRYYRSGVEMVRMAKIYIAEGSYDKAYVLYLKYISLFLEKIRTHPEFPVVPENEKAVVRENIKSLLPEAEKLKTLLQKRFDEEYIQWSKQNELQKEREKEREKENANFPSAPSSAELWAPDPQLSFSGPTESYSSSGLRQIFVPSSLIPNFLKLAKQNTQNNIETCGLLTGTLQQDRLTVTVLLIPQQTGTSDDCTAENDLATFNVIEGRGLITLGWIHTHPSQQAFLSSVDLHSQFGYQAMMPEALAIVCAPKYSNEIFRLSEMGLDVVGKCCQRGFHPHSGPPLFETASHAHIVDIDCEVVDLRNMSAW